MIDTRHARPDRSPSFSAPRHEAEQNVALLKICFIRDESWNEAAARLRRRQYMLIAEEQSVKCWAENNIFIDVTIATFYMIIVMSR